MRACDPLGPLARSRGRCLFSATSLVQRFPAIPYGSYRCYVPYPCNVSVPSVLIRCGGYIGRKGIPRDTRRRGCHGTHQTFLINCSQDIPHLHRTGRYVKYRGYIPLYPRGVGVPHRLRHVSHFIRGLGRKALWEYEGSSTCYVEGNTPI